MTPIFVSPNLDHKTTLLRTLHQRICVTSSEPRPNDIVLNGILPLQELSIGVASSAHKLHLLNFGLTTLFLVENIASPTGPKPVITEFSPRMGLFLQKYVDFPHRYFIFPVFTPESAVPKLAKLGINISVDDKTLWIEYKII